MVSKFTLNSSVYMNIDLTKLSYGTQTHGFLGTFTSARYRLDGGAWVYVYGTDSIIFDVGFINELYQIIGGAPTNIVSLPSTYKRLEIVGTLSNFTQDLDYSLPDVQIIQTGTIENPITITLYQLKCEPHVVNKGATNLLNPVGEIMGALREEINILAPSILIEYPKLPDFDYVYIPKLLRYYFVQSYNCVRNNIYRIELKVDVLYSFNTDIRKQNALVSRCSRTDVYCAGLIDERIPLSKIPNVTYDKWIFAGTSGTEFNPNLLSSDYTIVITTLRNTAGYITISGDKSSLYDTDLPTINNIYGHSPSTTSFAITYDDWVTICDKLLQDDTLVTYIVGVYMYPFKVNTQAFVSAGLKPIYLGETNSGASGYQMQGDSSQYIRAYNKSYAIGTGIQEYEKFLLYEPYTKTELFIPFYGWVPLDRKTIVNCDINVYYIHNWINGQSKCLIYNNTKKSVIDTYPINIGVKLSISSTNARENENQRQTNQMNMVLGMYSGAIHMGTSIASQKYSGVFGGAFEMGKAFVQQINADMYLYDKGQTLIGSEIIGTYGNLDIIERTTKYLKDTYFSILSFLPLNGYKWNKFGNIGPYGLNCTGHTEIEMMHYEPDTQGYITKNEIDEIISLARDGIIL